MPPTSQTDSSSFQLLQLQPYPQTTIIQTVSFLVTADQRGRPSPTADDTHHTTTTSSATTTTTSATTTSISVATVLLTLNVSMHPENHTLTTLSAVRTSSADDLDLLLLSDELAQTINFVNFAVLCTSIATFGVFANVINVVVFVRQGFKDTINVSLFTLALADMASLMFLIWVGVCFSPILLAFHVPFRPTEMVYLTGGMPRLYFTRVAGWITSVVAVERCFCVLRPMKVKLVFTRRRLVAAQVLIVLVALTTMVPVYYTTRFSWKTDPATNETYLGLAYIEDNHKIDRISFALGVSVSISAFVVVTSCTFVLTWSLIKQSRWRAKSMSEGKTTTFEPEGGQAVAAEPSSGDKKKNKPEMSTRDRQAVRTVTFIAAMFVVCLLPNALNLTIMSIVPEYNKDAKYQNIYLVVWSFAQITEAICSSSNIFVYYKTSTKFKETVNKMFNIKSDGGTAKEESRNK